MRILASKLGQVGLLNRIGQSISKSDSCGLNDNSDFDNKIGFPLKPDSIKTMTSIKIGLFAIKIHPFSIKMSIKVSLI